MKIIFDLRKVGLGNNGGSSTLMKSGNMLQKLGHDVYFIDSSINKHTWEELDAPHLIIKNTKTIPDADCIIATGYKSVGETVRAPKRCGVKLHWIRAWETWQYSEPDIVKHVLNAPTIKIVNSICLQQQLKKYKVESYIVRPGYDFDLYHPTGKRDSVHGKIIVGGLYREGVHGRRKRTEWLFNTARVLKGKYNNVLFYLFGSEIPPTNSLIDYYLRQPTTEDKNEFYNSVHIWMAPTESEGLHLPPAEAMMTGCPVVATDAPLSGTQDYLVHNHTGIVTDNNIDSFIDGVLALYHNREFSKSLGLNAVKKIEELGDRKANMIKFVQLLESLK